MCTGEDESEYEVGRTYVIGREQQYRDKSFPIGTEITFLGWVTVGSEDPLQGFHFSGDEPNQYRVYTGPIEPVPPPA